MATDSEKTTKENTTSERWGCTSATARSWSAAHLTLIEDGRNYRSIVGDEESAPIKSLSHYCQERGVFTREVVLATGLTYRTLNRLAKKRNTHRVRDLVAGVVVQRFG